MLTRCKCEIFANYRDHQHCQVYSCYFICDCVHKLTILSTMNTSYEVNYTLVSVDLLILFLVVLPSMLLSMLCVLILILPISKSVNAKIRFLIINMSIADVINWFHFVVCYLGWPMAHLFQREEDIVCKISVSLFIVATMQKFIACASYSLNVYIFVKYGERKLKWYIIVIFLVAAWIISAISGTSPFYEVSNVTSIDSFCIIDGDNLVFKIAGGVLTSLALLFLSFQLVSSLLTIVYVKRNVLEGNEAVKKAVTKIMACLCVSSIFSFISLIVPIFVSLIPYNRVTFLITYVFRKLLVIALVISTTIITIAVLKPIRVAMKTICKKVFCFCLPNNQIAPANEATTSIQLAVLK